VGSGTVARATTPAHMGPEFYGVNAGAALTGSPEGWGARLAAMRDAGISVVRDDASWDSVEPQAPDPATGQHQYRWAERDARVAAMARHGLRWYPIVDYSAPWASSIRGDPFAPPARDEDFATFAGSRRDQAGRYGSSRRGGRPRRLERAALRARHVPGPSRSARQRRRARLPRVPP
jgi:hypothetical protein